MKHEELDKNFPKRPPGTKAPKISLCMIVKNEEQVLSQCLSSAEGLVDEIILVDTGSSDETMKIGSLYGARMLSISWEDDFSKARNISLKMAGMEWILVLDADEVISPGDHHLIRELISNKTYFGYSLEQRTYGDDPNFLDWIKTTGQYKEEKGYAGYVSSFLIRLFRNDPRILFEGKVHELVEPSFERHRLPYLKTSVPIHHYGKVRESSRIHEKAKAYLTIGLEKVRLNPHDPKAYGELGAQHMELKDYKKAAECFERSVALNPSDQNSYVNLGVALLREGALEKAEETLNRALSLNPENEDALFNMGGLFLHKGEYSPAEQCFRELLRIRGNYGLAYGGLGMVFLLCRRIEEGILFLLKAVSLNPGDADAYSNLAWASLQIPWPQKALGYCEQALRLSPGHKNALKIKKQASDMIRPKSGHGPVAELNQKGESFFEQGDTERAKRCFHEAIELDPYDHEAWNNLGVLLWNEGAHQESLTSFLRGFFLNPHDPDTMANLFFGCKELSREDLWSLIRDLGEEHRSVRG